MAKVVGICISEKKGTQKTEVPEATLVAGYGIENDAHAGKWHRQVSLLSFDKIEEFRAKGADVDFGAFGENIIIDEYDFRTMPVGTRFKIGDVLLELTQIGKECHTHCAIYHAVGDCIMPREGVFTEVLVGGHIKTGDEVVMIEADTNRPLTAAVVTVSDKGSAGLREDGSGPIIVEALEDKGFDVKESIIVPDENGLIQRQLCRLADQRQVNLIITTGGTGFAKRDVTPEATIAVCDKLANGISEAIRAHSMQYTPRAMFSRAVSGIRKNTLIINLPGSPKAVSESLEFLVPNLEHGLEILKGSASECARK
ncbi:MAG: molybdopterin-binding protein [Eubacteriales bacterium]|nr:molybdopterin-binding protein [Eubacteriales bacterium]MDY3332734.1 molybdopterin-binding protein [Gallibacter sp.]